MVINTFSYFEMFLDILVLIRLQRWRGRECFAPHSHGSERAPTYIQLHAEAQVNRIGLKPIRFGRKGFEKLRFFEKKT